MQTKHFLSAKIIFCLILSVAALACASLLICSSKDEPSSDDMLPSSESVSDTYRDFLDNYEFGFIKEIMGASPDLDDLIPWIQPDTDADTETDSDVPSENGTFNGNHHLNHFGMLTSDSYAAADDSRDSGKKNEANASFDISESLDREILQLSKYDVPLSPEQIAYAIEMAKEFGIPVELIFGVMYTESRYTESAISKNGKYIGIMQIARSNLKRVKKRLGVTDLQDYYQNVKSGAYFLSYFYKKYNGDIDAVLMCYHRGEGGAIRCWKINKYTDNYCRTVKKEMERINPSIFS